MYKTLIQYSLLVLIALGVFNLENYVIYINTGNLNKNT